MKLLSFIALAMLGVVTLFGSITLNIYLHELGHYFIANSMGLDPEMHFNAPISTEYPRFFNTDPTIAYVTYKSGTNMVTSQDAVVALAGPLMNFLLTIGGLVIYFKIRKTNKYNLIQLLLTLFIVSSAVAILSNIIPIGPSDGYVIIKGFFG